MDNLEIARVAHEVNRAYCMGLGDFSHPAWEDAPDWQRENAVKGVTFVRENPDAGPDANHAEWFHEKAAAGWTYHAEKDVEKKRHPCMLPFDKLPHDQQAKDYIFQAVVKALL